VTDLRIGLFGATSLVGKFLIPLLINAGARIFVFSRHSIEHIGDDIALRNLSDSGSANTDQLSHLICLAPIWVLPEYFPLLEASGVRRVVALSSTSRFTKVDSGDAAETAVAARLIEAEERFVAWAKSCGVDWVILRPTLIYGLGHDKNISEIARFIRRFSFFPVFGHAQGLRQPIHARDVAAACLSALQTPDAANHCYNISGGETLAYRDMVGRVFDALGSPPRLLSVPFWAIHLTVNLLRCLPRYRHWSAVMAERMNRDLVFDHSDAARDLGFKPVGFTLKTEDLPQ
jgi:nucleoside-diphosphate-sugar epimerase